MSWAPPMPPSGVRAQRRRGPQYPMCENPRRNKDTQRLRRRGMPSTAQPRDGRHHRLPGGGARWQCARVGGNLKPAPLPSIAGIQFNNKATVTTAKGRIR